MGPVVIHLGRAAACGTTATATATASSLCAPVRWRGPRRMFNCRVTLAPPLPGRLLLVPSSWDAQSTHPSIFQSAPPFGRNLRLSHKFQGTIFVRSYWPLQGSALTLGELSTLTPTVLRFVHNPVNVFFTSTVNNIKTSPGPSGGTPARSLSQRQKQVISRPTSKVCNDLPPARFPRILPPFPPLVDW